jgi:hypothetical protein
LYRTKITDAGLAYLSANQQLAELQLIDCAIGDAGLPHLYGRKNLTRLLLQDTNVTPPGITELCQALPGCRVESSHRAQQTD